MNSGISLLTSIFPHLTEQQCALFEQLEPLYTEWNSHINVISRKDMESFYLHHVLHSLSIAKVFEFAPGSRVLDVGTGGGFPGIPLAILFPEVEFLLVDSIAKKIKVTEAVRSVLNLTNVKTVCGRVESLPANEKFDFVVTRAVAPLPSLVGWCAPLIKRKGINSLPNGILALKGGDLTEEIKGMGRRVTLYPISDFFSDPYFETKFVLFYC